MQRTIPLAGALLIWTHPVAAEVQISPNDGAGHAYPSICSTASGFVAVWERRDADGRDVVVQSLSDAGEARGASSIANETTEGDQQLPDVACRPDGSFLVVWESRDQDGEVLGVYGRDFAPDGAPRGDELQLNTHSADNQRLPRVCVDADGDAVVVWESFGQDGDGTGIYARQLPPDDQPGDEFRVNFTTEGNQSRPAVACAADGSFVVAWENRIEAGAEIVAKLYDATGNPVNEQSFPPPTELGFALHPELATLPDGSFALAYESNAGIELATLKLGAEVSSSRGVSVPRNGRNEAPALATDGANIFAAWSRGDGFDFGIETLRLNDRLQEARGGNIDSPAASNDGAVSTLGRGLDIATAQDGDIVAWQRRQVFAADSNPAIFVQRFLDCIGDCSADGVVRVNELIVGVRINLGQAAADTCASLDANGNGTVEVNELIRAVNEALASICPAPAG